MGNSESNLSTLEAKGWNLYRALPNSDLAKIISLGKVGSIERDKPHLILPAANFDNDVDDVSVHLDNAHETKQLPKFDDNENSKGEIECIILTKQGLNIKLKRASSLNFFDTEKMIDAIRYYLSNYNVHYFSSIENLRKFVESQHTGECNPNTQPGDVRWKIVHPEPQSTSFFKIYPSNPTRFLFRGQNKRYRPCNPAIVRNIKSNVNSFKSLTSTDQASVILNLIRIEWFNHILRETAAMKWLSRQKVMFNETAIAQHYGIPTGYIDLSESFDIASFFACCKFDFTGQVWQPVEEGEGVIYVVERMRSPVGEPLNPICLQSFLRPSEQWAWVHEIRLGQDFDHFPYVQKCVFKHNAEASQEIINRFDSGKNLFPPDPLSKVADNIMKRVELPATFANAVVQNLINDPSGVLGSKIQSIVSMVEEEMGVKFIQSCKLTVMDSKTENDMNAIWEERKTSFTKGVGFDLVNTINS